jgi:hypothetical protein
VLRRDVFVQRRMFGCSQGGFNLVKTKIPPDSEHQ